MPQNGNFREVQKLDNQNPRLFYVDRTPPPDPTIENDFQVVLTDLYVTILIIWCVIAFFALMCLAYKFIRKSMDSKQ